MPTNLSVPRLLQLLSLCVSSLIVLSLCGSPATAQSVDRLRVVTWNVTNYTDSVSSARNTAFQTAIYGTFQGRSLAPDIFIGQEFTSTAAVTNFLSMLNTAPGTPGDWAAAPFVNGPDSDSAFFYRTSKASLLNTVTVFSPADPVNDQPRNTMRYDVQVSGGQTLSVYSVHMKSGNGGALDDPAVGTDRYRRVLEAQRIRNDAAALPANRHFMVAGDFNIQSSQEDAFQELNGTTFNSGLFKDPINTPGTWNNNSAFRFIHTQDPKLQMDDRLDMLLLSSSLVDGTGMDYIGNPLLAYSTTTWDDANHSYRAWGNDGSSYDTPIRVGTTAANENAMVGRVIAQSLIDSVGGSPGTGGHLPVYLDIALPVSVAVPEPGTLPFVAAVVCLRYRTRRRRYGPTA
jgi:endonuclease/exonuclease/phosphatase family metal-dependent hydrolase